MAREAAWAGTLKQGVGQHFHSGTGHCCCFLSRPRDMEKAAHAFGQMPDGLLGWFSFGRPGPLPKEDKRGAPEGAAGTHGAVLTASAGCQLGCPSQELEEGCGLGSSASAFHFGALLGVWKSHSQTSRHLGLL